MTPLGIWNATTVRLFYVKHAQAQQRGQITETVTNAIEGFLEGVVVEWILRRWGDSGRKGPDRYFVYVACNWINHVTNTALRWNIHQHYQSRTDRL